MKLITFILILFTLFFPNSVYSQSEKPEFDEFEKKLLKLMPGYEDSENYDISMHCKDRKTLIVPNGIKHIIGGMYNFKCTKLEKIILPKTLKEIGMGSFENLMYLKEITIPEGVTRIGSRAFSGCRELSKVILPQSLLKIEDEAFSECYKLKDISFSDKLQEIGARAFNECEGLEKIFIPLVKKIGSNAFANCSNLTVVDIPQDTELGLNVFKNCEKLEVRSEVEIDDVYLNCSKIKKLIIPDGISEIEPYTFEGCKNIQEVVFPNSLQDISNNAFSGCLGIKELNIPYSIKRIDREAFSKCSNLEKINFVENVQKAGVVIQQRLFLYFHMLPRYTWTEALFTPLSFIIRGSQPQLEVLGDGAFDSCVNLEKVMLPNSIQYPISVSNPDELNQEVEDILYKKIFSNCKKINKIQFFNRNASIEEVIKSRVF